MDTNTFPLQFCTQLFNIFLLFQLKTKKMKQQQQKTPNQNKHKPHFPHIICTSVQKAPIFPWYWKQAEKQASAQLHHH